MPDMLVNLMTLPKEDALEETLHEEGIIIRRAISPDKFRIVPKVQALSTLSAAGECDVCFSHTPVSLFVATKGAAIIGYACYNATAPDFFGPTAVEPEYRGKGIGKALLLRCMRAMRNEGYVYAIIGGVGPAAFYEKTVGATVIPGSDPGIYVDFIGQLEKADTAGKPEPKD